MVVTSQRKDYRFFFKVWEKSENLTSLREVGDNEILRCAYSSRLEVLRKLFVISVLLTCKCLVQLIDTSQA